MSDVDHAAEARAILKETEGSEEFRTVLLRGLIHAQLAQTEVLHEIAHAVGVVRPITVNVDKRALANAVNEENQRRGRANG